MTLSIKQLTPLGSALSNNRRKEGQTAGKGHDTNLIRAQTDGLFTISIRLCSCQGCPRDDFVQVNGKFYYLDPNAFTDKDLLMRLTPQEPGVAEAVPIPEDRGKDQH